LIITGAALFFTWVSRFLDWGVRILDWAHRFDYLRDRNGLPSEVLHWLFSPQGSNVAVGIALIAFITALILAANPKEPTSGYNKKSANASKEISESPMPAVQILTPLNGEEVGWRRIVRGSIFPPDSELQLLIRPSDGWWHLQRTPSEVRGLAWSYKCEFGEKQIVGYPSDVVAIHGTSLTDDRYKSLPENVIMSNIVTVNRRLVDDFIDCSDKVLHQTGVDDRSRIRELVKVCAVYCDTSHLAEGDKKLYEDFTPYIDFVFSILNFYLYPVSIELSQGFITFQKDATGQTYKLKIDPELTEDSRARNCAFRDTGCFFKIRQDIDQNQIGLVATGSKESVFYFSNLKVMITGEGFQPVLLDIPNVQKGIPWIAHEEAGFVQATIATLKSDHAAQVEALNKQLEDVDANCKSRLQRVALLSEVIGRGRELIRVHNDPRFIPLEEMKPFAREIERSLNECYGNKALEKFYPFKFRGERMEGPGQYGQGHAQWFIDYFNNLTILLEREKSEA
jgi:hypothetical protein